MGIGEDEEGCVMSVVNEIDGNGQSTSSRERNPSKDSMNSSESLLFT